MAELDYDRADEKKAELVKLLNDLLSGSLIDKDSLSSISEKVMSSGLSIYPPDKPDMRFHMLTMDSFHSSSESTKPGNIRLNTIKFLESIGTGFMTFTGGLAYPWLYLVGFTLLWKQLWDCATVEIGESENKVLWAMWELRCSSIPITLANISKTVAVFSQHYQLPNLSLGEISLAISRLEEIETIQKTDNNCWRIIEWIRVPYR